MKIVYWGSSAASADIARSLIDGGCNLILFITQPDREKGRGRKRLPTPVKNVAGERSIPVLTPDNPNTEEVIQEISRLEPDLFFLCAYAKMLRKDLLEIPPRGALNLHFSLLPQLRGAAPIQRAIMNGFKTTGVTTFFMNESLDKGDIILQKETDITAIETAGELEERLVALGKILAKETIISIQNGNFTRKQQDTFKKSYARKIQKEERAIDWTSPAIEIVRRINGLSPYPGSFTYFKEKRIILLKAMLGESSKEKPATIIPGKKITVIAGDYGSVIISLLRPEGKKTMTSKDFINGFRIKNGDAFHSCPVY
ncbi:MAG: methionyl-tRNA formyltransferase [Candidatus Cloacimonadota bacterium]|nr:MAG: methionyl-tRNA formyltransferase [Candidatus Cloacimonadota bacterium]